MAVAIAKTKRGAIKVLMASTGESGYIRKELEGVEPKVFDLDTITPMGWVVSGGG